MPSRDRVLLAAVRRGARSLERATIARDDAIRAAAQAGLTRRQIAEAAGVTFQRVDQIVHSVRVVRASSKLDKHPSSIVD